MNERSAKWYRMAPNDVVQQLHTDAACGLSRKAARSRIKRYGFNTLFDVEHSGVKKLFRMLLPDSACIFMLGTVLLSLFFADLASALLGVGVMAIVLTILLFLFSGIYKTYGEIARYRIPSVSVMRNGRLTSVGARRIVQGDVLLLKAGDIVPCDCRLLTAEDLRVLTLMPNEKGAPVYRELPKNAETVYPYGAAVFAPSHENMLYGGSEILCGCARAVAVETGKYTYLGAMSTFRIPAEVHAGESGEDVLRELRSYLRVYGFLMLALLLLLTLIGILTAPSDVGVLDVFYPLCVVCGAASPVLLMLYFRFVAMHETVALMNSTPEENRAVIKVGRTTDRMNGATDLFLLGHKACSDGILHFYSAMAGAKEMRLENADDSVDLHDLCEAFVLLNQGSTLSQSASFAQAVDDTLLRELIAAAHFDVDALQIRLVRVAERSIDREDGRCIDVQTNAKTFSLLFVSDPHLADCCQFYEDGGRRCAFSAQHKAQFHAYCERSRENACKVVTVIRKSSDGVLSLVGAIAGHERIQPTLAKELASLTQSGVRLSFFLDGDAIYEDAFATVCGLPEERIVASEQTPHLTTELLDTYRVFIGFPAEEVISLLHAVQKQRRCTGVLCGNAEDRRFLNAATFTVVCDATPHHKKGTEEMVRADSLQDGREHSAYAAQSMRRHADAVILRATPEHGGLSALSEFFFSCRAVGLRMHFLLSYLISVNMLRVFAAIFCTLFGVGLPGGVWMLYSCLLLDVLATRWILALRIPRGFLRKQQMINEHVLDKQIFSMDRWLPMLISVGVVALYIAVWRWFGVITQEMAHAPIFIVMLLSQLWILHSGTTRDGIGYDRFFLRSPAIQLLLPLAILIPLSILIPAVGQVTALGAWHPVTLIALPIFPLVYFLARYFIGFFHRTAK